MDDRLKKKIFMFHVAGVINLALGLYVLIAGPGFLPQKTVFWLTLFFLAFAVIDFWFPRMLKKRWAEMMAKHAEQQAPRAVLVKDGAAGDGEVGRG
jgi:uncharacterized membrane protein